MTCRLCRVNIDDGTPIEKESRVCEGCAIAQWERDQALREQVYLEDDRNWPEPQQV